MQWRRFPCLDRQLWRILLGATALDATTTQIAKTTCTDATAAAADGGAAAAGAAVATPSSHSSGIAQQTMTIPIAARWRCCDVEGAATATAGQTTSKWAEVPCRCCAAQIEATALQLLLATKAAATAINVFLCLWLAPQRTEPVAYAWTLLMQRGSHPRRCHDFVFF